MSEWEPTVVNADKINSGLRYGLLGRLQVSCAGRAVVLSAEKHRILLVALLLKAGRIVPVETLIDLLWDEEPPPGARSTLQVYISRLRKSLGRHAAIRHEAGGYVIEPEPGALDLHRFEALTDRARRAASENDPESALSLLREATGLWRGPILCDISARTLHERDVPQLIERFLKASDERFELELELGHHKEIIAELTELTSAYPMHERLRGHLILALYRSGRQAEALAVYRNVAKLLREDLGVDPSEELQLLHQSLVTGEAEPRPSRENGSWLGPCQLPPDVPDFIGRTAELQLMDDLLTADADVAAVPVINLSGPPGVGKTTLAVHAAHRLRPRFRDGQLYMSLSGSAPAPRPPDEVLAELLSALGTDVGGVGENTEVRAAAFRARLADKRVLVLLDDAADARQVAPLLPGTAGCAVVVTSRGLLAGPPGAASVPLGPLSENEAIEFLGHLAGSDRISAEPESSRQISAMCGHLPLALRIAGARLTTRPSAPLSDFARRLRDQRRRLDELSFAGLEIRTSLETGYRALDGEARTALRRLGLVRVHDITAWLIALLTDHPDADRLVESLTTANLLQPAGTDATGEPRYRLHDLTAVYAAELAERDDPESNRAARQRLLDHLTAMAGVAYRSLPRSFDDLPVPPGGLNVRLPRSAESRVTRDPIGWLMVERELIVQSIVHGCRHGRYAQAAQLVAMVVPLLHRRTDPKPLRRMHRLVGAAARAAGDEYLASRSRYGLALLDLYSGKMAKSQDTLTGCVEAFERLGRSSELSYALSLLTFVRSEDQAAGDLVPSAERALELAREAGDRHAQVIAIVTLSDSLVALGRPGQALAALDRALSIVEELGEPHFHATVLHRVSACALDLGDLDLVDRANAAALLLVGDMAEDRRGVAWIHHASAKLALRRARPEEAINLAERGRRLFDQVGDQRGVAKITLTLAQAQIAANRPRVAVKLLEAGVPPAQDNGCVAEATEMLRTLQTAQKMLGS
jgi:DNA-binding SARP family transcriptional activator